jgi:hypothetical protein
VIVGTSGSITATAGRPPEESARDRLAGSGEAGRGAIARTLAVAAVVALGLGAAVVAAVDRSSLADLFHDDAYYYFQIARNIVSGNGVTFDGLHPTNGFHPLWLLLLLPVFALVPGEMAPLRVAAAVQIVLAACAAAWLYRICSVRLGRTPALLAALLLIAQPGAAVMLRGGMETSLTLGLLVTVWGRWLALPAAPRAGWPRWLELGLWCSLLLLARLEAVLAVPVLAILGRAHLRRDAILGRSSP